MTAFAPAFRHAACAWWLWCFLLGCVSPTNAQVVARVGQNFTGSVYGIDTSYTPPDCNGVAGPSEFVELINGRFSIYAKTNGTRLITMPSATFWTNAGITNEPGVIVSDPRVIFDKSVGRWFASAVDFRPGNESSNRFLLAVSATADPSTNWTGFAFMADPIDGNFADFPSLGLDRNGVYLAADMYSGTSGDEIGQTLVSFPKADLLALAPTVDNRTWFGLLDSGTYGYILQPAVTLDASPAPNQVLAAGDLGYDYMPHTNLVAFAVQNAAGPGPATLSTPTNIIVSPFSLPMNPTQPDGNSSLDDGDARFSAKVCQVAGVLYGVQSSQINGRPALCWYRIDAATQALLESGTISDTNLDLFYGSIAANEAGTLVIAFNGCSTNSFVSSYAVAGQTIDGVTTFGPAMVLKAGLDSYSRPGMGGISRWGDYSSTCVDPGDPNRFWTLQMYPVSSSVWATQISEVLTLNPRLALHPQGTNIVLSWPGTAIRCDLQSVCDLSSTNWTLVPQSQYWQSNGIVSVLLPAGEQSQLYRLQVQ